MSQQEEDVHSDKELEMVKECEHGNLEKQVRECEMEILKLLLEEQQSQNEQLNEYQYSQRIGAMDSPSRKLPYKDDSFQFMTSSQPETQVENNTKVITLGKTNTRENNLEGEISKSNFKNEDQMVGDPQDLIIVNNVLQARVERLHAQKLALDRKVNHLWQKLQRVQNMDDQSESYSELLQNGHLETQEFQAQVQQDVEMQNDDEQDYLKMTQQERLTILVQALCEAYKSCQIEREELKQTIQDDTILLHKLNEQNDKLMEELQYYVDPLKNNYEFDDQLFSFSLFDVLKQIDGFIFKFYSSYKHAQLLVLFVVLLVLC
eukprot:TRINITY_DN21702_c0_g2_i10.p2 TRINITY_DN21702_c0_g2~~TRINITY_DN21702_c0_g2_i10.p2  ORF type:complete len:337 (-),score=41.73 TRINITY_DN21702_c0_g2_i10:141-1097(-)